MLSIGYYRPIQQKRVHVNIKLYTHMWCMKQPSVIGSGQTTDRCQSKIDQSESSHVRSQDGIVSIKAIKCHLSIKCLAVHPYIQFT